jgi:hypothetical protein
MRPATDLHNSDFQSWAADFSSRLLQGAPFAGGLFVDNSTDSQSADFIQSATVVETSDWTSYNQDMGTALKTIYQKIAPRWLLPNTSGYTTSDPVITNTGAEYWEKGFRARSDDYLNQFVANKDHLNHVKTLTTNPPYEVIDTYPSYHNSSSGSDPTSDDAVTQYDNLAYYYLLADPNNNFLDLFGGFETNTSWSTRHWNAAEAVSIGTPVNSYSTFDTGTDPGQADNTYTYYVYQRTFQNALVLYKPLSYSSTDHQKGLVGSASDTTKSLGGTYYLLSNDGTSTTAVTSVTLEDGQGAILLTHSLGAAAPAALATSKLPATNSFSMAQVPGSMLSPAGLPFGILSVLVPGQTAAPLGAWPGLSSSPPEATIHELPLLQGWYSTMQLSPGSYLQRGEPARTRLLSTVGSADNRRPRSKLELESDSRDGALLQAIDSVFQGWAWN